MNKFGSSKDSTEPINAFKLIISQFRHEVNQKISHHPIGNIQISTQ